jgi:lipoate-protein ligase A
MTPWRLLKLDTNDASANMAIDEAIMRARIKELVPNTVRFYRWNPSAVSIGRFQDISNEVYLETCQRNHVDIVRRITGGGTVYHDSEDEITYSVIVNEEDLGTQDVVVAYNTISNGLIEAAKILGVNASFDPGDPRNCPNIAIDGKKISGSAQFHKSGVLLQHGTFLLNVNLTKMFTFLKVPWAKTITDVICVASEKITSIKNELASNIAVKEAHKSLIKGFQKAFAVDFSEEKPLTTYERKLAKTLKKEKYETNEWNLTGKTQLSQR